MELGNEKDLTMDDLYKTAEQDKSMKLSRRIQDSWDAAYNADKDNVNFKKVILNAFPKEIYLLNVLGFFDTCLKAAQALLIGHVVGWVTRFADGNSEAGRGILLVSIISVVSFCIIIVHHLFWFYAYRVGFQIRVGVIGAIYHKTTRLSQNALNTVNVGQIMNHTATDALKIEYVISTSPYLWLTPVQTVIMLYFLIDLISWSGLLGFFIILALLPIQSYQGKLMGVQNRIAQQWADKRLRVTNELINGMRIMKMFAWEERHSINVTDYRDKELTSIKRSGLLRASMNAYSMSAVGIYSFFTFLLYHFLGYDLTPEKVYGTISIFMLLKYQVAFMFPFAVQTWADGAVSCDRIEAFLKSSEFKKTCNNTDEKAKEMKKQKEAELRDAMDKGFEFTVVTQGEGILPSLQIVLVKYNKENTCINMYLVNKDYANYATIPLVDITEICSAGAAINKSKTLEDISEHDPNVIANQCIVFIGKFGQIDMYAESSVKIVGRFLRGIQLVISQDMNKIIKNEIASATVDDNSPMQKSEVRVNNLTCTWDDVLAVNDLSLNIKPREFIAIVGPVGAGKSSFLMALLGELPIKSGNIRVSGTMTYTSQLPWGFSGSVKSNIIMEKKFDQKWFDEVCKYAALMPDLQKFDNREETEVGENGITLSGGQKARVGLARALYDDADVYLFDDPLSAVDPEVGKKLFHDCMKTFLKNKTRILVTHQIQHVRGCDRIVVLNSNGTVSMQGTYEELLAAKCPLIVSEHVDADEQHEETKEEEIKTAIVEVKEKKTTTKLAANEKVAQGSVSWDVYKKYFSFLGGFWPVMFIVITGLSAQTIILMTEYWLAHWVSSNSQGDAIFPSIYATFLVGGIIFAFLRSVTLYVTLLKGSKVLHDSMLKSLVRTTMSWIDYQPSGRIMNRFSSDLNKMDTVLLTDVDSTYTLSMAVIGSLILICILSPMVIALVLPAVAYFIYVRNFYLSTSRQVKRLDAVSRSPIQSSISALVAGLVTIRCMKLQGKFVSRFYTLLDYNTRAAMAYFYIIRWMGARLDFLSASIVSGTAFLSVITVIYDVNLFPAAFVGLALTQTLGLMAAFQMALRYSAEVENQMTSTERVMEYTDLPPENETRVKGCVDKSWPSRGHIIVKDLSLQYASTLPVNLKKVNLEFKPLQKVGIVGRTGSGKSSFLNTCFFRMVEFEGQLIIDGVDVQKIGLHDLRERIGVIPQDPTLFQGTVRSNLDPFNNSDDESLWKALESAQMKKVVENLPDKLDGTLTEGGTNLSVGQRQLMCLARAIVRGSRILVVDEATANVDLETDKIIQKNIRETFKECTVLVVAHRLNTIIDSDLVVVLDYGNVVECGIPHELLQNRDGHFSAMVRENGPNMEKKLHEMAKEAYPIVQEHALQSEAALKAAIAEEEAKVEESNEPIHISFHDPEENTEDNEAE